MANAIKDLIKIPLVLYDICQMTSLFLNLFFCIDLYLTFRNPFYPNGRRLNWYFTGTAFFVVIFCCITTSVLMDPSSYFKEYLEPVIDDNSKIADKISSRNFKAEVNYMNEKMWYHQNFWNAVPIIDYFIVSCSI